jgi:hypothetical protein
MASLLNFLEIEGIRICKIIWVLKLCPNKQVWQAFSNRLPHDSASRLKKLA